MSTFLGKLPASYAPGLITGFLRVHVHLNTAAVTRAFQRAGFEAVCLLEQRRLAGQTSSKIRADEDYFLLKRGTVTIRIAGLPLGQILFEGLPLEEFVAATIDYYRAAEDRRELVLPGRPGGSTQLWRGLSTYTNMEEVWRKSREFIEPYDA